MRLTEELRSMLTSVTCGGPEATSPSHRPLAVSANIPSSEGAAAWRQTVARCERVLACMPLAVIELVPGARHAETVAYWGGAAEALLGWQANEAQGRTLAELGLDELARTVRDAPSQLGAAAAAWLAKGIPVRGRTRAGEARHWRLYLPRSPASVVVRPSKVLLIEDVTERVLGQLEVQRLTQFDGLTGLPNRLLLERRLEQRLSEAGAAGTRLGLVLIDIDDFKYLNLAFGHAAGDELLRAIAERLRDAAEPNDIVARLEGAKFAASWMESGVATHGLALPHRLARALRPPFPIEGQELELRTSVATTVFPDDGATTRRLFRNAEMALHRARSSGDGHIESYSRETEAELSNSRDVQRGLRTALEADAFELHYQPLYDIASGQTGQVEALIRWPRDGRYVPPSTFIPIAESTGLISALGDWVLRAACRQAAVWYQQGLDRRVAINVSAAQLRHAELYDQVRKALRANRLPPCRLELELTESVFLDPSKDAILRLLQRLADLGVTLAIDDFGTGYSSLAYLKYFPFHKVKIDGSFVRDIGRDVEGEAIVTAVIALSHSLGKRVVGEGVETAEQLAFLRQSRCDLAQGYYLGMPQNAAQLDAGPLLH